ncbi:hypothetical protein K1T71_012515 [Dendrolimus kikuchii]|uniref:Uncharacterized protein n=1 Tax=Dendrolimus kikuchii TaxID=765133 RepID=A0ACC1CJJ9_9NEOP|nr:hypothetical protein K1T71_012515 [Dendrolimus kikuchii]
MCGQYLVIILLQYIYDDDETTQRALPRIPPLVELEFEPQVITKEREKVLNTKNLNCDDFSKYALNCTMNAALMYNSSRKAPPMPDKLSEWCRAIRYLTECAIDWNTDCKEVTESHFNEESIKGHMHVVNAVCDDELFLIKYDEIPTCIEKTSNDWEKCYATFKKLVDEQKNTTHEWTHFETHHYLCCARAKFRRCTLEMLFQKPSKCSYHEALTLQRFSVIVSEGDVFQDCEHHMLYSGCPGGDPRPSGEMLVKLMNVDFDEKNISCQLKDHLALIISTLIIYAVKD